MSIGLIGRKCGMTRIFCDDGSAVPVTVINVEENIVTQRKNFENDGYTALQVKAGEKSASKMTKGLVGHYAKANVKPGNGLYEFRLENESSDLEVGDIIPIEIFEAGQKVNVRGISIGKGYQGTVKRHNFSMQDATHGNSLSHRAPGSNGMNQTPGRVFKGKKMSGRMGGVNTTVENLTIHSVDSERNLILIKGAIPGSKGSNVIILPASKIRRQKGS